MFDCAGVVEDCDIHDNGRSGVIVFLDLAPTIRHCRVRRNGYNGISFVYRRTRAAAVVEDCVLCDNKMGDWEVEGGCRVTGGGNRPPPPRSVLGRARNWIGGSKSNGDKA